MDGRHIRTLFSVLTGPLAGVFFLAAALTLVCTPARAADIYEVRDVTVDVTAETAAKARELALAQGESAALEKLLERLTMRFDRERLPKPTRQELASLVRDFDVAEEKTSAVRYLARLNYRFKEDDVRALLRDHGVPFAETESKPVLILSVFERAGAVSMWDDPNPWRDTWKTMPPRVGLVPFVMPLGDLADIATIGHTQALEGDIQSLGAIAKRYGAADAVVAYAIMKHDPVRNGVLVEVFVTRYGTVQQEQTLVMTFFSRAGESEADMLRRAATEITAQVEDHWKRDNLLQFGNPAVLAARIPVQGLADWIEIRRRLGSVAVITRVDLVSLSRSEVQANLHFLGGVEQLSLALEQIDLSVNEEMGSWVIGFAGTRRGAGETEGGAR
ncbi:MAG: DUF2066 domain-containing protein [Rhodospirillales bacterium]|nr:DUF2066 domain-containing protein [Rhodospirillales bacterium]MCW8862215.1 DUF2066 domain-containing protein [Rhodospirillales bacterium]MCW8971104.1 DUF2066 domain-containing protein [Rhodospirillales bacterium]MCW9001865.1 DUF2066 domain-containing protein [Rhodospirillales bacterium]MCW9039354.1 DUF2066 domain-containing protein [Rhodospirillales bacterium]